MRKLWNWVFAKGACHNCYAPCSGWTCSDCRKAFVSASRSQGAAAMNFRLNPSASSSRLGPMTVGQPFVSKSTNPQELQHSHMAIRCSEQVSS